MRILAADGRVDVRHIMSERVGVREAVLWNEPTDCGGRCDEHGETKIMARSSSSLG
jgi:hypothetical protein